jgi:uncharacterized membrane protein YhaH (DUF805 family)/ribosomal protein L37AE/L43A
MSANNNERNSAGLSLQPKVVVCPKCQYKRAAADQCPEWQCPSCGVAYSKATAPSAGVALNVNIVRGPGRREIDHDELETVTPSALSLSIDGRIGRLRYLAYSWPLMVLSGLAILAAVIVPKTPAMVKSREIWLIPLGVLFVLWLWTALRLMALRLHDVNRSAKWVLALLFLPGVGAVMGGPQMVPICSSIFWIVSLLLIVWPGSEGYNDYGPPADPNTALVKVGAGSVFALMVLGVVGTIKYMQYARAGNLNAPASAAQGAAEEPPESSSVQTPKEKALAALRQSVQEISATLPRKIDRVTTLTAAEVRADTYKVYYSLDASVQLDASRKDATEQAAKQKICRSSTRTLRAGYCEPDDRAQNFPRNRAWRQTANSASGPSASMWGAMSCVPFTSAGVFLTRYQIA